MDSPEIHALESAISLEERKRRSRSMRMRQKLIDAGMPEQIAFIHDANTEVKKRELFAKVRSGQARVRGQHGQDSGTNVQDRLVALHDRVIARGVPVISRSEKAASSVRAIRTSSFMSAAM